MNRIARRASSRIRPTVYGLCLLLSFSALAGNLLPPVQVGNILKMTNANVRLEYDLGTGRAGFFWKNSLKIAGFYSGVGLETYITGTAYSSRTWAATNNEVTITLTGTGLPTMKQIFILDQDDSFLTRMEVHGTGLRSRWMGPLVMDTVGGVDIGSYGDNRALIVPFDNDSWTFAYNAMPMNNTGGSYEVSAFYDNSSRNGLVVGSVTHDRWKTGVYFQGANNRLNVLNVYGGVADVNTRDVMPHGEVQGNPIVSPTVFVAFGTDWRAVMEAYGDANARIAPKLAWDGGVPFGWNSWYAYTTGVNYSNATAASAFIKNNLQTNHFNNRGVVYVNLDSYWSNLSDTQLRQFADYCRSNGQKAGIYWTPFVYWGTASQGSNSWMTGTSYKWSDAYLRTADGSVQIHDGGIAIDPTHPGTRLMIRYYISFFKERGFEYLKLDFLSHGAMEGVHYEANTTTGIQAYNQAMAYLVEQNNGRMFLNESIAPIFPYHYAHSRRIACDTSTTIGETEFQMQSVSYGWWISGRLYQFSDPDMMKFSGGTANENQSRLISGAVSGTVFLNGDDLASAVGQNLARTCLTNPWINEVARAGKSFRPIEGNTGADATDVFVRQEGSTWYVAVFNYNAWTVNKGLNLARLGITGSQTAMDLWSGALSSVSGPTWNVSLGARQSKLFRIGSGATSVAGPYNQSALPGESVTFSAAASGTPPFSYVWRRNEVAIGQNANELTIHSVRWGDEGTYTVEVTGPNGRVTNSAVLTVTQGLLKWSAGNGNWDTISTGLWKDSLNQNAVYRDGAAVVFDDTTAGDPIRVTLAQSVAPDLVTVSNAAKDYILAGGGSIYGGAAALVKKGPGRLILATDNGYTGPTTVFQGTLQVGEGGTRGRLGSGLLTNSGTLSFNRSDATIFPTLASAYPALLGGPGTLRQVGPGKLIFNYQYVFGTWLSTPLQGLYVSPGAIAETAAYNPVGPVTLEGGVLSSTGGASAACQSWVLCGGVTVVSNATTAMITNNTTVNDFSGVELRDSTVFNVAAGATNGIDLLVPAVLTHSYWEYEDWGTLVKTGAGMMVLRGGNLYQGETIISGGTLMLEAPGSIAASGFPVTVKNGGRFSGDGVIFRNVSVEAGGVLAPGLGALLGNMEIRGNLSIAGTVALRVNRTNTPRNDSLVVTNALNYGGTFVVTNLGPALQAGDTFKLFSKPGTGLFADLQLPPLPAGLGWTNKLGVDGSIAVMQTMNRTPTNITWAATATNISINWPEDYKGWVLQVQTNSSGNGLGPEWHNVSGSTETNRWIIETDRAGGSVFFRLVLP